MTCSRPLLATLALVLGLAACASPQRAGEREPDPGVLLPRLFNPTVVYQGMGLLAAGEPTPFVAAVRFLAGPAPESTLAVFGLSLSNSALSFRRVGSSFEAGYRIEIVFRREGEILAQFPADEEVRVAAFQETLRRDESVVFQRFLHLPPGVVEATVAVRDRYGAGFSRAVGSLDVPRYGVGPGLSAFVPVYEGSSRTAVADRPPVVVNPRATARYGTDTLTFYLEAYDVAPGARAVVRAVDAAGDEVWRDTVDLEAQGAGLAAAFAHIAPDLLPVGELWVAGTLLGGTDTVQTVALVSLSDQWAVASFLDILSLLRYFGHDEAIEAMQAASATERAWRWREFWRGTDPDSSTPENEALDPYFAHLREANARFREQETPGWLTDRGEVFMTLGEPDEIYDSRADLLGGGLRMIRWSYAEDRLSLDFVDGSGFGDFRLTPSSRADYAQALIRVREGE